MLTLMINCSASIKDMVDIFQNDISFKIEIKKDEWGEKSTFRFLDTEFVLFDNHGLDDDCGISFSNYKYQLDIIELRSGMKYKHYDQFYKYLSLFLSEKLSNILDAEIIIVEDLQKMLLR